MPFTASHPAAVLPLLRTGLPSSALVLGSMAPDFLFYLPAGKAWAMEHVQTHDLVGLFTVDVALGSAGWLLWHGLLARPALAALPAVIGARIEEQVAIGLRTRLTVREIAATITALVVGGATHILWDAFTHEGRWGADHIALLRADWGPLPGYKWGQIGSSAFGLAVLAWWSARWLRRASGEPLRSVVTLGTADRQRWVWAVVTGVGAVVGAGTAAREIASTGSLDGAVFDGLTGGGSAAGVAAVVLATAWQARRLVAMRRRPTLG